MGGSASKSARKLPTSIPTASRQAPNWANTAPPPESTPPPPPRSPPPTTHTQPAQDLRQTSPLGRNTASFSGEKDDAIRRDALDPDFASNLSRLGPVQINDPGRFVPTQAAAQRTLSSRRDELADLASTPPKGHLTASLLSQLLDQLKGCSTPQQRLAVYKRYQMSEEVMELLRRRVNSPSVGEVATLTFDGKDETEMKAVWVDGPER